MATWFRNSDGFYVNLDQLVTLKIIPYGSGHRLVGYNVRDQEIVLAFGNEENARKVLADLIGNSIVGDLFE